MIPESPLADAARIIRALVSNGVEFVVCGGAACVLQGVEGRLTADIDLCVQLTDENLRRFVEASRELQLQSRIDVAILFATSNPHKLDEVRAIFRPMRIDVYGLDVIDDPPPEPVEDGATFEENARLKAAYYAERTGEICLADDSGLEVDALGGAPGVHSARYASQEFGGFDSATRSERDAANNAKLLRELKGVPAELRTARFVCAMCLSDPDGNILAETRGTFEGVITDQPRGSNGFGYDPLLYLPDRGCTSAELSPEEKNSRSHRGNAARQMVQVIRDILKDT